MKNYSLINGQNKHYILNNGQQGNSNVTPSERENGGSGLNGFNNRRKETGDEKEGSSIRNKLLKGLLYIIIGLGIILMGWFLVHLNSDFSSDFSKKESGKKTNIILRSQGGVKNKISKEDKEEMIKKILEEMIKKILNEEVSPAMIGCIRNNEEVLNRCLQTIDERSAEFYTGIDPFLEDITSLRTKVVMGWKWIQGDHEQYVVSKFSEYVVSEQKLEKMLDEAVQQAIEGIEANINKMDSEIKVNLQNFGNRYKIPQENIEMLYKEHYANLIRKMQSNSFKLVGNTILNDVFSGMVGGMVGSYVAINLTHMVVRMLASSQLAGVGGQTSQSILVPAMAKVGAKITSTTLSGVGSTAVASGVTGGTIGSFVPVFGTICGFVIGLGVNYLIEEYLNKQSMEATKGKISLVLDEMKIGVRNEFKEQLGSVMENLMNEMESGFSQMVRSYVEQNKERLLGYSQD